MASPDVWIAVDVASQFVDLIEASWVQEAVAAGFTTGSTEAEAAEILFAQRHWQVDVRITDDAGMRDLNLEYRGIDRATDVLSFSMLESRQGPAFVLPETETAPLGEIAISYPLVLHQAEDLGHSVRKELAWLLIHGTLQLLGYTHDTDENAERMERLEQQALAALGPF